MNNELSYVIKEPQITQMTQIFPASAGLGRNL